MDGRSNPEDKCEPGRVGRDKSVWTGVPSLGAPRMIPGRLLL
ncbi:MAG TPA: hypothetical protein VGT08_04540 [Terracidiphilus sp.]|nr:hypothetical protein [Terracidiphilus sp.]